MGSGAGAGEGPGSGSGSGNRRVVRNEDKMKTNTQVAGLADGLTRSD